MTDEEPYSGLRWHMPLGGKVIGRDHPQTEEEKKKHEDLIRQVKALPDSFYHNEHAEKIRQKIKEANKLYGFPEDENL
ncbi:hypothetical protein PT287_07805 [Lactobacillus sp. ESL0679]|uniref:hypothetical protein n=1 Tax=Lactobacillus sp. ESL0679 TaxID=2983209 RepID=UPI0023F88EE7|nr:hypothetical protein [Lactobacillus sp. ESL0679]MDF7683404.1 hypothetical protein [Lactobacillus sp. ESL0679]